MGKRLSKIYTKTGDKGTTGLGDGTRVSKTHPRVEAYGTVDELNSAIGLLLTEEIPSLIREVLVDIQHDLFDLGGELCIPGHQMIDADRVEQLETTLDSLNSDLAALEEFILPGGSRAAALCHTARTVCRRAERRVVTLGEKGETREVVIRYLNRLSDLLFVMARSLNRSAGYPDVLWRRD